MTPAMDTSKEEQAIQKQVDRFVAAWNRHDPRAMSEVYSEDADLINPSGRAAKTRSEILALFRDEQSGPYSNTRFSLTPKDIRFLTPEIAVTNHAFEVAGNYTSVQGHVTQVFRKRGDTWESVACRPMIPASQPAQK